MICVLFIDFTIATEVAMGPWVPVFKLWKLRSAY